MSRVYRELVERYPEVYGLPGEDERDQRQAQQSEFQFWLADRAAQAEYASWLDTLNSLRPERI